MLDLKLHTLVQLYGCTIYLLGFELECNPNMTCNTPVRLLSRYSCTMVLYTTYLLVGSSSRSTAVAASLDHHVP